jgi:hypothetical protein
MLLDHDGTYAECIESLDDGVDPLQAETAVETVEKTGDTAFRYRCRANGEDPARTRVYQRALRYTVGEPPAADAK